MKTVKHKPSAESKQRPWLCCLLAPVYFALVFAYIEFVFHVTVFRNGSALFPILFSIPAGFFAGLFCNLFPGKAARWLHYIVSVCVMVLFCVQIVYHHSFQAFMSLSQVGMADDVFTNFLKAILLAIWESAIPILAIFLPLVGLFFLHRWIPVSKGHYLRRTILPALACGLTYLLAVLLLPLGGTGEHSAYANYHNNWILDLSVEKLGVLTTSGIDVKQLLFGSSDNSANAQPDVPIHVTVPAESTPEETVPEEGPEYNVIAGLDFAALAEYETNDTTKQVFQYLSELEPTQKNEYTGMFEGYNLILITAESFSPMGIHPEATPTLYKLANSGFQFTNYWTMYPSNTTNGEYSNLTGLIPDISKPKSNGSFVFSARNTMNMNIANYFNAQGVTSRGYHNHNGDYYYRDETHPNIGYQFKGRKEIGGLTGWPESDLVMMEKTVGEYINEDRFHTYYMTVSGHHNYKFGFNTICDKNKSVVKYLDMAAPAKAYIATHVELDRALQHLIESLEAAGKLEKTVICITTDHYPYGLTDSEYSDMLGHSLRYGGLERYQSNLILWNSEMDTITIDKPCCQVDVLPTLLNLFGFTYDSRLYSGTDILSDSYGLAMTSNQSFITDKIIYNSRTEKVYILDENWQMPEGYLDAYIQIVKNRFSIASNILNYDIYDKLPADVITVAQSGVPKEEVE